MKTSPPQLRSIVVGLLLATSCVQPGLSPAALDLQARRIAARDARVAVEHFSAEPTEPQLAPADPVSLAPATTATPTADHVQAPIAEPERTQIEQRRPLAEKAKRERARDKKQRQFTLRGYVLSSTTDTASVPNDPLVVFAQRENEAGDAPRGTQFVPLSLPSAKVNEDSATTGFAVTSAGGGLTLTNVDDLCHAYFSSSGPNAFDHEILNPGESREITFQEEGVVHIYCTLHEGKQASVLVAPTPHHSIVADDGSFSIAHVAPGEYMLSTWSSTLPTRKRRVTITNKRPDPILIDLQPEPSGSTE